MTLLVGFFFIFIVVNSTLIYTFAYRFTLKIKKMNLENLKAFIKEKIKQYPNLKEEIFDFYSLCLDEVEGGGSEMNEVELCINDVNSLIEKNKIN